MRVNAHEGFRYSKCGPKLICLNHVQIPLLSENIRTIQLVSPYVQRKLMHVNTGTKQMIDPNPTKTSAYT